MTFLAIVAWTGDNRVSKFQDYEMEADATTHVDRVKNDFPDAFAAPHPGGSPRDWLVDPVVKTLSVLAPPLVLITSKAAKRGEFKVEALIRITAQVSAWNSFERIEFLLSIANMLDTASMDAAQTLAKDILLYTKNTAIPKVNAVTNLADLNAIDPTAADPFGDGTAWPI